MVNLPPKAPVKPAQTPVVRTTPPVAPAVSNSQTKEKAASSAELEEVPNPLKRKVSEVGVIDEATKRRKALKVDTSGYSVEEFQFLHDTLNIDTPRDYTSSRDGSGSEKLTYVETWRAIDMANKLFGFNGWKHEIRELGKTVSSDNGRGGIDVGMHCIVRVTLKDGTFHDGVGFGITQNAKSEAVGLEKAYKEAESDAMKRALKNFGRVFGLSLYDKEYRKKLKVLTKPDPNTKKQIESNPQFDKDKGIIMTTTSLPEDKKEEEGNTE